MADASGDRTVAQSRRRNRRPMLLFPALQTAFLPPPRHALSRLYRWLAQPLYRGRLYDWSLGSRSSGEMAAFPTIDWPDDTATAERLLADEFRFGAEVVRNPKPLSSPLGASLPWRGYMNGFAWLDQLRALGGPAARAKARQIVDAWLLENARYDSLSWRADLLAERLHRLLVNHAFLEANNDAMFRARLLHAVNRQATHLARAGPDGRLGAEVLKGAISLLLAGAVVPNGEPFAKAGRKLFQKEAARQILADGGHIERSPAIMRDLLRRLIDLRVALEALRVTLPDALAPAISGLAGALALLCHDDGDLSQFNDTSAGEQALTGRCLAEAGPFARDLVELPDTGFQRLASGRSVLVQDCGRPPPGGYDRHAHAGTLAFEFSHAGERIIVNCGAHPDSLEWRAIQRATAAHSTLVIEDTNSSVLLRLDEKHPGGMALRPEKVVCRREETPTGTLLESMHDGYVGAFGLTHLRRLMLSPDGEELAGEEHLLGKGRGAFALRFHLHPNIQAVVTHNGQAALLKPQAGPGWRLRMQGGDLAIAGSAALTCTGQVRRAQQLVVLGLASGDATRIKWSLQREARRR